jgi:hypothetical protein
MAMPVGVLLVVAKVPGVVGNNRPLLPMTKVPTVLFPLFAV